MKKCVLFLVFVLLCAAAGGEVRFSGLDLAPDNHLLFRARADLPDFGQYDTLFLSSIPDGRLTQLTFFPERISFLRDSGQLQIQNRFGVFRSDAQLKNITAIDIFPSFVEGSQIGTGKIYPLVAGRQVPPLQQGTNGRLRRAHPLRSCAVDGNRGFAQFRAHAQGSHREVVA